MCKHFDTVITIACSAVKCLEGTLQCMLMHSIRIVSISTLVRRTLNKSKRTAEELVVVDLVDVEFLSASDVGSCDHSHIIHLCR